MRWRDMAQDRPNEGLGIERLDHEVVHSGRRRPLALAAQRVGGECNDRQGGQAQLTSNPSCRVVAVEDRHLHIHEHDVDGVRPGLQALERFLPVAGDRDLRALEFEDALRDVEVDVAVVDDEHAHAAQRVFAGRSRRVLQRRECLRRGDREFQLDPELAADARRTLQADLAAQEVGQPLDDGKPKPRAAEPPRDRRIGLSERREQERLYVGRNADAGVSHSEAEGHPIVGGSEPVNAQGDGAAALGELDRVRKQIGQDLVEACGIAFQGRRKVVRNIDREGEPVGVRLHRHHVGQFLQQAAQAEGGAFDDQLTRLDLREIQHVVEHDQQRLAGELDFRQQARLLLIQRRLPEEVGQADHRVHRRSDLVAHVGEKLALGTVRLFGLVRRLA